MSRRQKISELGIAVLTGLVIGAAVILIAVVSWQATVYFRGTDIDQSATIRQTTNNNNQPINNGATITEEIVEQKSVVGFFKYLAEDWLPVKQVSTSELQALQKHEYAADRLADLPVPNLSGIGGVIISDDNSNSNINDNTNLNVNGDELVWSNLNDNSNSDQENTNENENINQNLNSNNENDNLNINLNANENDNPNINLNTNSGNDNENGNANLNTNQPNANLNGNTNVLLNINVNLNANANQNSNTNQNINAPIAIEPVPPILVDEIDWYANVPEGSFFVDPNWYCSAAGMQVVAQVGGASKDLGRFHGDCTNPDVIVKGIFTPSHIGHFKPGDKMLFTFSTDHYTLGNYENTSTTPGFCQVNYFKQAGLADIYAAQYTCDDGLKIGLRDDIQFTVYVFPKTWPVPADIETTLAEFNQDGDGDSLTNQRERELGTDPMKSDTDCDGYNDKTEVLSGHDPLKK